MESPHHGALDPGSHPRTATEAAHSGGLRSLQHNPDVLQWCVVVCRYVRAPRSHAHVVLTKGMGLCQQRVSAD